MFVALKRLENLACLVVPQLDCLIGGARSYNLAVGVIRDVVDTASVPFHRMGELPLFIVPNLYRAILA